MFGFQDWAAPGDIDNLQIAWHEPSEEEMAFATQVVEVVLKPELEAISKIPTGTEMPRYVFQYSDGSKFIGTVFHLL